MLSTCMLLVWLEVRRLTKANVLEARQSDWKDEAVLIILTLPILVIAYGVFSDDPNASIKIKEFLNSFNNFQVGLPISGFLLWLVSMV